MDVLQAAMDNAQRDGPVQANIELHIIRSRLELPTLDRACLGVVGIVVLVLMIAALVKYLFFR